MGSLGQRKKHHLPIDMADGEKRQGWVPSESADAGCQARALAAELTSLERDHKQCAGFIASRELTGEWRESDRANIEVVAFHLDGLGSLGAFFSRAGPDRDDRTAARGQASAICGKSERLDFAFKALDMQRVIARKIVNVDAGRLICCGKPSPGM